MYYATHDFHPPLHQHWDVRLWGTLIVLCGALFLDGLDISMVGVALPSIGEDLGLSTGSCNGSSRATCSATAVCCCSAAAPPTCSVAAGCSSSASAVFAVASLLGGLASDGDACSIATRFVKGVCGRVHRPGRRSRSSPRRSPRDRRATERSAIYAAVGASGFSLGLVFGGLLTSSAGAGRSSCRLRSRSCCCCRHPADPPRRVAAGRAQPLRPRRRRLRECRDAAAGATVVRAPEIGWGAGQTLGGFAVAAILLAAFVAIERRVERPLVRLGSCARAARARERRRVRARRLLLRASSSSSRSTCRRARLERARDGARAAAGRTARRVGSSQVGRLATASARSG